MASRVMSVAQEFDEIDTKWREGRDQLDAAHNQRVALEASAREADDTVSQIKARHAQEMLQAETLSHDRRAELQATTDRITQLSSRVQQLNEQRQAVKQKLDDATGG